VNRSYYLELAAKGLRFPIGTHLTLHEKPDHAAILMDGARLGDVIAESAKSWGCPMAIPLMDLTLEKDALLSILQVPAEEREKYHFSQIPDPTLIAAVETAPFMTPRMEATCAAIGRIADHYAKELVPVGMGIGPFSFTTKLLSDPITPVFMAGSGMTGEDDDDIALLECATDLSLKLILRYLTEQCRAGAKAIILCEPAANLVYFSPNQLAEGSDVYQRLVINPNLKIKALLESLRVDLIFHDCGELTDGMVQSFNQLDPAMLSLGCSRTLWEDANLVSKQTVLYGNLPSKKFYSDDAVSPAEVERLTVELIRNMREAKHPFVMGTECDVLSVPGKEEIIKNKVRIMMECKAD
jgi:uroporphyrinogen-III decarboxylase